LLKTSTARVTPATPPAWTGPSRRTRTGPAPVIRRLAEFPIGAFTLTDEESWAVAIYLAILNRRVPSATATLGRQFEALREYWTIAALEDPDLFWQGWPERGWPGGRDEAEATRLSFLAQLRDPGTKLTDADLVSLLGVGEAPFIAEQLCHMTWTVLRRTQHPRFVIGDTPAHVFAAGPSPGTLVEADDSSIRWQVPLDPGSLLVLTAPNVHPELQDQVVDADGPDPTLDPRWQAVVADAPHAEDAALFHAWVAWGVTERWVWARDKSDLDRLSDWIRDPERREPGSVRQRHKGFFRPDDPAQLRAVVKEVQARPHLHRPLTEVHVAWDPTEVSSRDWASHEAVTQRTVLGLDASPVLRSGHPHSSDQRSRASDGSSRRPRPSRALVAVHDRVWPTRVLSVPPSEKSFAQPPPTDVHARGGKYSTSGPIPEGNGKGGRGAPWRTRTWTLGQAIIPSGCMT
jgi:hypothetical protein